VLTLLYPQENAIRASRENVEAAAVQVVISRWMVVILSVVILAPWLAVAGLMASWSMARKGNSASPGDLANPARHEPGSGAPQAGAPLDPAWVPGTKGPWGNIETMRFSIDIPDEFVFVPPPGQPPVRWNFPGYEKSHALAKLRSLGVPDEEVKKLDDAIWNSEGGMASVEPGDRLILSLSPEVRAKLYELLVVFPQNARAIDPIWFRPGTVDWRLKESGLAAESIGLLKRLLYPQGKNLLLFADFEPALRALPDEAERRRFMKAVSRKQAVLARVKLEHGADIDRLSDYWGIGGRKKDVLPLLAALARAEKGDDPNVVCLLPTFARDHLYRHPFSPSDRGVKEDCFWSAFNFFNEIPDNSFNDLGHVREVLDREYAQITNPEHLQLGDLVFLAAANKTVIHVATYVADDLVFTKNGEDFRQPWLLMHMADMVDTYAVKYPNSGTLTIEYYRKRSL
jgi:hypothetical protein